MSTSEHYVCKLETLDWQVAQDFEANFRWEYDGRARQAAHPVPEGQAPAVGLGRSASTGRRTSIPRIPAGLPDEMISIFGSPTWDRLDAKERTRLRQHIQAWQLSQFLHGEQGALVCTAKIVQQVPNIDAKFYAATQVMDEARHVEAFARLLHEKVELVYPINPHLKSLLDDTLRDSRWDMTYLGMQVLIEGLALAAFGLIRDYARNPLSKQSSRTSCRTRRATSRSAGWRCATTTRADRQGARRARGIRRRGLLPDARPVPGRGGLGTLGLPVAECREWVDHSELMRVYRTSLFSRIVPTIRDIGLWGPRIRKAYADMGILGFAEGDVEGMGLKDEQVARELEARLGEIQQTAAAAAS